MAAHNLKEARDIDIVVAKDLFNGLKQSVQWESHTKPNGGPALKKGAVEVFLDVNSGNHNPNTEDLINEAEIIDGVPFISLLELIKFKEQYNRPKDVEHIKIIKDYLNISSDIGDF